jgi:alpha-ketoglutarate-dependent taurine dioxygenase
MAIASVDALSATFGARVSGVSLAKISADDFHALHELWLKHSLLHVPAQYFSEAEQIRFARLFGPLEIELIRLSNVKSDGAVRDERSKEDDVAQILRGNEDWHADSTYMPVQAKGAVFSAVKIPSQGTQTEFADMSAAYDALDSALQSKVRRLSAHHSLYYSQAQVGHHVKKDNATSEYRGYGLHDGPAPLRPLVKIHPVTGRPALLIGRHAYSIPGLPEEDSRALLAELLEFACQRPRVYRHEWTEGDVVIWDNRCLLHRAVPYDMREPRIMWHSRIAGDPVTEADVLAQ